MTRSLDDALYERNKLLRSYNRKKKYELLELYADQMYGEWFRRFVATLNHFSIEHGDRMIEYVRVESKKWLAGASVEIRHAALTAIDNRCVKIRERAGLPPFDDTMPGEEDNVFFTCKSVLGL